MGFTTCVEASVTSFAALSIACVWHGKFGKSCCGGIFVLMCSSIIDLLLSTQNVTGGSVLQYFASQSTHGDMATVHTGQKAQ